jgi:hypothetical protein
MQSGGFRRRAPCASLRVKAAAPERSHRSRSAGAPWTGGFTRACVDASKNPRVGERFVTHGFPRLQHADFAAEPGSACQGGFESAALQALHAGGGTRTPDTRIMMTARRGRLRRGSHGSGVLRCFQFSSKSEVRRTVGRTVRSGSRGTASLTSGSNSRSLILMTPRQKGWARDRGRAAALARTECWHGGGRARPHDRPL